MSIDELRHSVHIPRLDPASRTQATGQRPKRSRSASPDKPRFSEILNKQLTQPTQGVRFSSHAVDRLASRNIVLSDQDLSEIGQAVDKVAEKGGKESLLMMNNLALLVSVENRTVITAMDKTAGQQRVFTNIDSAMMI